MAERRLFTSAEEGGYVFQLLAGYWRNAGWPSCLSVKRVCPCLYVCPPDSQPLAGVWFQNEESYRHDFFTIREPEHSTF